MQNFKIGQTVFGISWFFDFQDGCRLPSWIFKFLNIWSTVTFGGPICIAEPNYTKIDHGCRDIAFNIFQNGGRSPSLSSGWLICVIVKNFSKISQTHLEISWFFDFQDGRRPPSWILKFWSSVRLGRLIDLCIVVPNFIKLVTVAETSHLTIFNMAVVRHGGFFSLIFWNSV